MSERFYFIAVRYKDDFIKAMTISDKPNAAIDFALKNLGYYVAFWSVSQIREAYVKLGLRFEI